MSTKQTIDPTNFEDSSLQLSSASAAAVSPDGAHLVTGNDVGELALWEVASARLLARGKTGAAERPVIAYRGSERLVSGGKTLSLFDAATLKKMSKEPKLKGHRAPPNAIAFAPDGSRLLSAGGSYIYTNDCFLRVWDANTGEELTKVKLAKKAVGILDLLVDPRGRWVATSGEDLLVRLHSLDDLAVLHSFELPAPPEGYSVELGSLAATPDGDRLAVSSGDGRVFLLDTRKPEAGEHVELAPPAPQKGRPLETVSSSGLCFSPDGRFLIIPRVYAYEDDYGSLFEIADVGTLAVVARHATDFTEICETLLMPGGGGLLTTGDKGAQLWPLDALLP